MVWQTVTPQLHIMHPVKGVTGRVYVHRNMCIYKALRDTGAQF